MEHNQNAFTPYAECDSATGNVSNIATGEPLESAESVELVSFDRQREDGWTPQRQRQFLEELADCGIIHEAAARVGMSRKSASQLRQRAAGTAFASAWEAALQAGMKRLHSVAFERAIEGVVKRVYYRGEVVGEERIYDNRLLLSLLGKAGQPFDPAVGQDAQRNWHEHLDAIGQGLTRPGPNLLTDTGEHMWVDEKGLCWTDFPPPGYAPGYRADHAPEHAHLEQKGEPGEAGYCRKLTHEEFDAVRAREARLAAEQEAHRARFFSVGK